MTDTTFRDQRLCMLSFLGAVSCTVLGCQQNWLAMSLCMHTCFGRWTRWCAYLDTGALIYVAHTAQKHWCTSIKQHSHTYNVLSELIRYHWVDHARLRDVCAKELWVEHVVWVNLGLPGAKCSNECTRNFAQRFFFQHVPGEGSALCVFLGYNMLWSSEGKGMCNILDSNNEQWLQLINSVPKYFGRQYVCIC